MFGPGEDVSDPTEGLVDVKDLPAPQRVPYSGNQKHPPCPRCDLGRTGAGVDAYGLGDLWQGARAPVLEAEKPRGLPSP